jgi:senataxin
LHINPSLQVFLVGDPNQLPATVLSSAALEHGYNTSMFERLQAAGYPVQVASLHGRASCHAF